MRILRSLGSRVLAAAVLLGAGCGEGILAEPKVEAGGDEEGLNVRAQGCPAPLMTPKWEVKAAAMVGPSPVAGAMVYDNARRRLVVLDPTPGMDKRGATWEFDGTRWVQAAPPEKGPPGRDLHGLAYDSGRDRVVLYGGRRTTGFYLDDTWEWDGVAWTQVVTGAGPGRRASLQLAYDSKRRKTVLFGGFNGAGALGDTWEYDGSTWTQAMPASSPSARSGGSMTYDEPRGRVILAGGSPLLADTWEYDGVTWLQSSGGGQIFPGAVIAYDKRRGRTIAFGGQYSVGTGSLYQSNETMEYDGSTWSSVGIPGAKPVERTGAMMAYDSRRGRIVLYGGYYRYDKQLWEHYLYAEPNRAPVLDVGLGNRTVYAGDALTFTVKAADADMNPVTLSATGLPAGATLDATTGVFSWTPGATQAGTHVVQISASDGCLSVNKTVNLTVLHVTYPGFGTGAVDMRASAFQVPSYFEDCGLVTGCKRSSYYSLAECKIQGTNPGKLVASCTVYPYTAGVFLPSSVSASAPIGADQRFLMGGPYNTVVQGAVEQRGADVYVVISSFEIRWNTHVKTASSGSASQLLAPYP